jgi:tetrahydromethanopterin S-methyltransferase subunit C
VKHLLLALGVVLVVAIGVAGVVLGEADDSPGLQGLGGLLVVGAVVVGARALRRTSRR